MKRTLLMNLVVLAVVFLDIQSDGSSEQRGR
jgi:hypothetical protein